MPEWKKLAEAVGPSIKVVQARIPPLGQSKPGRRESHLCLNLFGLTDLLRPVTLERKFDGFEAHIQHVHLRIV